MSTAPGLRLLEGVRVLAFTQFLMGPIASQYLADMGADVIKVEQPGNGAWERSWSGTDLFLNGVSAFFLMGNRNMRSVTINLKSERGREVALKLAQQADVIIENFRPGVLTRLGVGYEKVRALNPRIIYASGSGYGSDGPYSHLPGQDLLVQAVSGLGAGNGTATSGPQPAGSAIVDQHSASLLAMGVLAALVNRDRTGEGQRVELIMLMAALDLQNEPVMYHLNGAHLERPKTPLADTFHKVPYGFYATADGQVAVSMSPIKAISAALGSPPELAQYEDPELAFTKRDEIRAVLDPFFRKRTTAQWVKALREHDIWCAPVNDLSATFEDIAVKHIAPAVEFDHPTAGRVRALKHPVRYSSGEASVRRPPPGLGEHTDEILAELGYDHGQIHAMRESGDV